MKFNKKTDENRREIKSTILNNILFVCLIIVLIISIICNIVLIIYLYKNYKLEFVCSVGFYGACMFLMNLYLKLLLINYEQEIINKMSISFNDVKEVEYGTKDYDVQKELVKEIKDATLKEVPKIDTSKVGDQVLKFILTQDNLEKEVEYKITIKDTKAPEIKFKEDSELIVCKDEINCTSKNIISEGRDLK